MEPRDTSVYLLLLRRAAVLALTGEWRRRMGLSVRSLVLSARSRCCLAVTLQTVISGPVLLEVAVG